MIPACWQPSGFCSVVHVVQPLHLDLIDVFSCKKKKLEPGEMWQTVLQLGVENISQTLPKLAQYFIDAVTLPWKCDAARYVAVPL